MATKFIGELAAELEYDPRTPCYYETRTVRSVSLSLCLRFTYRFTAATVAP